MNLTQALATARKQLQIHQVESCQLDALILLAHCLGFTKEQVLFSPDFLLTSLEEQAFFSLINRRANKEPVSHLRGYREFFGYDFIVTSQVLDPRPDSEVLVETALNYFPETEVKLNILELGVGSGCLLLSILKKLNHCQGVGVDININSLKVAVANAKLLALEQRVGFLQSDWFQELKKKPPDQIVELVDGSIYRLPDQFGLIISNPPYIARSELEFLQEEVRIYEPRIALDGGEDGLDNYRQIADKVKEFLTPAGVLILEIGQNQHQLVIEIFEKKGLKFMAARKDLANIIRCVVFKNANN